jgi:cytochrome c oxidase subunit 4
MAQSTHADGEFSHPAPLSMLFGVFAALLALTGLTVYQASFDLGNIEIWLSLVIATVKASLVILFFMHLLWDKPLNAIIILGSLIFVALFLGFTLMDLGQYKYKLIDVEAEMDPATRELIFPTAAESTADQPEAAAAISGDGSTDSETADTE